MISWRFDPHEDQPWDQPDLYQASVDRQVRVELREGWPAPEGWRRPVVVMCRKHRYGLVDGLCGVCLQEASLSGRSSVGNRCLGADEQSLGVEFRQSGGGNVPRGPARPESDEREAD